MKVHYITHIPQVRTFQPVLYTTRYGATDSGDGEAPDPSRSAKAATSAGRRAFLYLGAKWVELD